MAAAMQPVDEPLAERGMNCPQDTHCYMFCNYAMCSRFYGNPRIASRLCPKQCNGCVAVNQNKCK